MIYSETRSHFLRPHFVIVLLSPSRQVLRQVTTTSPHNIVPHAATQPVEMMKRELEEIRHQATAARGWCASQRGCPAGGRLQSVGYGHLARHFTHYSSFVPGEFSCGQIKPVSVATDAVTCLKLQRLLQSEHSKRVSRSFHLVLIKAKQYSALDFLAKEILFHRSIADLRSPSSSEDKMISLSACHHCV